MYFEFTSPLHTESRQQCLKPLQLGVVASVNTVCGVVIKAIVSMTFFEWYVQLSQLAGDK